MTKKFKVVSSIGENKEFFTNMEFDYVIDDMSIGSTVNCLGGEFKITQNGKILVLVNPKWVLTIMDITPNRKEEPLKLKINETIDIYFETKEIHVRTRTTYNELYNFLEKEWLNINKLNGYENNTFPLEMREHNNLLLKNEWNIIGFEFVSDGSFERNNNNGRSI